MDQNAFRKIISEENPTLGIKFIRVILRVFSLIYTLVIRLRNLGFFLRILRSRKVQAKVISIGNITTGGTGKTPIVMWLARMVAQKNLKVAILTRGYASKAGALGDEPAMLARNCPQASVIVNSNRYKGALKAIKEQGCKVLIMDDGFQHRKLKRDLDIIAIDATCAFGYNKMLPAGLLREPAKALKRAHAVIITRYDQVSTETILQIRNKIKKINSKLVICNATHEQTYAKMFKGKKYTIPELREKKIYAFCGIGNPQAFFNKLSSNGLNIVGEKIFNDHHNFNPEDMQKIVKKAKNAEADIILSTQKDWIKAAMLALKFEDIEYGFIDIELKITDGCHELHNLISKTVSAV